MFVVITTTNDGRTLFLSHGAVTATSRQKAAVYRTESMAHDALYRVRLRSDVDSVWHHGYVCPTADIDRSPARRRVGS